jgi:hypothetical protein
VITLELEYVTPDLARYYLCKSHENNRPLDWEQVKELTDDIRNGKWKLNNHLIAFDSDDKLVDGQHRLYAIARARVTVQVGVMRGVCWH